jgi:hypothetical protein
LRHQDIVRHTSTPVAPWHVVPADHEWFARVMIGSDIVSALEALDLRFPRAGKASLPEFKRVREALENEGKGGTRWAAKVAKRVGAVRPATPTMVTPRYSARLGDMARARRRRRCGVADRP